MTHSISEFCKAENSATKTLGQPGRGISCMLLVRKLRGLRRAIRLFVFLQLLFWTVTIGTLVFWLTYGVDRLLDLPVYVRIMVGLMAGGGVGGFIGWQWGGRLLRRLDYPQLALAVERVYPECTDLLVTAAEGLADVSRSHVSEVPYRRIFLQAVFTEANRFAETIRIHRLFRFSRMMRDGFGALLSSLTVAVFALWVPEEATTWAKRWLYLQEAPWPIRTGLVVVGFYRGQQVIRYGDSALLEVAADKAMPIVPGVVKVQFRQEGSSASEALMLRQADDLAAAGLFERFALRLENVRRPTEIWFQGGDAVVNGLTLYPKLPPTVKEVSAECQLPAYLGGETQLLAVPGSIRVPAGAHMKLLLAFSEPVVWVRITDADSTREHGRPTWQKLVEIHQLAERVFKDYLGGTNVNDRNAKLSDLVRMIDELASTSGGNSVSSETISGGGDHPADENVPVAPPVDWVHQLTRLSIEVRQLADALISSPPGTHQPGWVIARQWRNWLAAWEGLMEYSAPLFSFAECQHDLGSVMRPVTVAVLPMDRFGIVPPKPIHVEIEPIVDEPPRVTAELAGVGSAVTPVAQVTIVGEVEDNYGVREVGVEVDFPAPESGDRPTSTYRRLEFPTPMGQKLPVRAEVPLSSFQLRPGERIRLRLVAVDGCDLPGGPNRTVSPGWGLEIVTPDELRIRLEKRELLLRQQLDQVLTELSELRHKLDGLATEGKRKSSGLQEASPAPPGGQKVNGTNDSVNALPTEAPDKVEVQPGSPLGVEGEEIRQIVRSARSQVDKSRNDVAAISAGILQIKDEIINNRLDAPTWVERLEEGVARPLGEALNGPFVEVRKWLEDAEQTADTGLGGAQTEESTAKVRSQVGKSVDGAIRTLDQAIELLLQARKAMLELEDLRQLAEMLRRIVDEQAELLDATRKEHRSRLQQLIKPPDDRR